MILSKVEIENYKQYADRHEIEIPSVATIGVIGSNGVGKTTLFEAIEWCLYNPTTIRNADIRPRGRSSYTKVALTLEDPVRQRQFIIERELKRTAVVAAIYEVDEHGDEQVIVQGTKPVTDYVATKLIGLSHRAFVATFFTRQKELSFFGNLGESDRRREVSRLLGMETIRLAQQSIAEDRKRTQADALSYRRQYEEQSKGRDFAAEIATARETIAAKNVLFLDAGKAAEAAAGCLAQHETALKAMHEVRDRDHALGQQLTEERGKLAATDQRLHQITTELTRLDGRSAERERLLPLAERWASLEQEVATLEQERQRYLHRRELEQALQESGQRRQDQIQHLRTTVRSVNLTEAVPGWSWSAADDTQPGPALQRLQAAIVSLDLPGAIEREQKLANALDATQALAEASEKHARYTSVQQKLNASLGAALAAGDPALRLKEIDADRDVAQRSLSETQADQKQQELQAKQTRALIGNLDQAQFGDVCPTCARPFSEHDAAIVLDSLRARIATIDTAIRAAQAKARKLQGELVAIQSQREAQEKLAKDVSELRGRIANSVSFVRDQEELVTRARERHASALREAGLSMAPTTEQMQAARERVALFRRLTDCRNALTGGERQLRTIGEREERILADLKELSDVAFDEAHYRTVSAERQQADRAKSAIEQIDRELARRPELERDRASCSEEHGQRTACIAKLSQDRADNGFDPEKLAELQTEVQNARTAEREALEARHAAQIVVRDAHQALETLEKDQQRVSELALKADEQQREADTFDRMYREFTEFDKYAAAHYTPILSDFTSELVREVTDGKYDRVEFDSNYGIEVFDGTEEHFPLATFSGGERDAIALCARIALSRMIGSQAASPPGFLVLDEVFGSLDRDRRTRLLDMLSSLAATGESFQQMFVISHVDDVRTAPMFDELWRIEETSDGESQIHNLLAGTEIDDL